MKRKPFAILLHAIKMVKRNLRSYALLSITIILSFSVLLGFMVYMDSEHYNYYKKYLALDRGLLQFYSETMSPARVTQLQEKAAQYGTTHSTQYYKLGASIRTNNWQLKSGEKIAFALSSLIYSVPRECWYLQHSNATSKMWETYTVTWFDGRDDKNITLEPGQIIMDDQLFLALGLSPENNEIELDMYSVGAGKGKLRGAYTVVGTVPSKTPLTVEPYVDERTGEEKAIISRNFVPLLIFSIDDVNPTVLESDESWLRYVFFHSDEPENVKKLLETMEPDIRLTTIFEAQNYAFEKIRTEKGTKAIVAALLLLILGINLYSSFENALNDRKFEIGVKRAVGASGFSIVRQFFYESMIVMLADTLISIVLVVDVGLLWKIYQQMPGGNTDGPGKRVFESYILYITPYSVGMFAVCAVVLTVVFSFVFAYKTTQVQIVDYLKAE